MGCIRRGPWVLHVTQYLHQWFDLGAKKIFLKSLSFCRNKSAANLWRKASSPAGVHLLNLHRLSGFSIPNDLRQYEAGQLRLLSQLELHNHPGQKWTWKCCLCGWVKPGEGSYTPEQTLMMFCRFIRSHHRSDMIICGNMFCVINKNRPAGIYSFASMHWRTYIWFFSTLSPLKIITMIFYINKPVLEMIMLYVDKNRWWRMYIEIFTWVNTPIPLVTVKHSITSRSQQIKDMKLK